MAEYCESRWRRTARPIIARVLTETAGQEDRAVKAALREAYPFGPRKYHPYKIWLDEIALQRGRKVPASRQVRQTLGIVLPPDPRQQTLIDIPAPSAGISTGGTAMKP